MKIDALRAETISETQDNLIAEFQAVPDWIERYKLIIELGKSLPEFPEDWKTEEFKIQGCQSQVWIKPEVENGKVIFHSASDAAIVSGLIAILMLIYSNRAPSDIVATKPDFIEALGLQEHLSPTRSNGLFSMLKSIMQYAFVLDKHQGAAK